MLMYNNYNGHVFDLVRDDFLSLCFLVGAIFFLFHCFRCREKINSKIAAGLCLFCFIAFLSLVVHRIHDWRHFQECVERDCFSTLKGVVRSVSVKPLEVVVNLDGSELILSKRGSFSARDELDGLKKDMKIEMKVWKGPRGYYTYVYFLEIE